MVSRSYAMAELEPTPTDPAPAPAADGDPSPRFPTGTQRIDVPLEAVDVRPHIRRDPWPRKLARRALIAPLFIAFTLLWCALGVVIVPVLVVCDLVRRRPLVWTRFYVMIAVILFGQVWGLLLLLSLWLASGFGLAWRAHNRWILRAEAYWAQWNADWQARVYGITYDIEGSEVLRDGPTILLMRHASINDTILPISLITTAHGVRLRIVLKHELLYAPIVDCIGHRIPTAFIRRDSEHPERELAQCRGITRDLHRQETIMIFPEGTRFTTAGRAKVIARLRAKDPAAAARAEELTHVLPLRLGGTLALMEGAPQADLVFCAHTGYEHSARLEDFVAGGLLRATVKVKFWRVPATDVPTEPAARVAFFHDEWKKVNAWVAQHQRVGGRN